MDIEESQLTDSAVSQNTAQEHLDSKVPENNYWSDSTNGNEEPVNLKKRKRTRTLSEESDEEFIECGSRESYTDQQRTSRDERHSIPKQQELPVVESGGVEDADLTDAMLFLHQVKIECSNNATTYESFLEVMRDFKAGKINAYDVCNAVRIIFAEKSHLIKTFEEYLPHHLKKATENFSSNVPWPIEKPASSSLDGRGINHSRIGVKFHRPYDVNDMPPGTTMQPYMGMLRGQVGYQSQQHMSQQRLHSGNYYSTPSLYSRSHNVSRKMMSVPPKYSGHPMSTSFNKNPYNMVSSHYVPREETSSSKNNFQGKQLEFIEEFKKKYSMNDPIFKKVIDAMVNTSYSKKEVVENVIAALKQDPAMQKIFKKACDSENNETEPQQLPVSKPELHPLDKITKIMKKEGMDIYLLKLINLFNQQLIVPSTFFHIIENIVDNKETVDSFKKYLKFPVNREMSNPDDTKIGSYVVNKNKGDRSNMPETSKMLLNYHYKSVSFQGGEEKDYIFRSKNPSEVLLNRVGDERHDHSIVMTRMRFLLIKLTSLRSSLPPDVSMIKIEELEYPEEILREVFQRIYGDDYKMILHKLFTEPRLTIPKVIERMYAVYRDFCLRQRTNKALWRAIVEEHYVESYDFEGTKYKSKERVDMNLRSIQSESDVPITFSIEDYSVLDILKDLYDKYVTNCLGYNKKVIGSDKRDYFYNIVENLLQGSDFDKNVSFEMYAIYLFILRYCVRLKKVLDLDLEIEKPSVVALNLNLVEQPKYTDYRTAVIDLCKNVVSKKIDTDAFENRMRILTASKGYELYSIFKGFDKIDKLISSVISKESSTESVEKGYLVQKVGSTIVLSKHEVNEESFQEKHSGMISSENQ